MNSFIKYLEELWNFKHIYIHLSYTICIISIWMILILVRAQGCVEANLFFDHEWTIAFFQFEIIIDWIRFSFNLYKTQGYQKENLLSLMALTLKQIICILRGQEMWNTFSFEKVNCKKYINKIINWSRSSKYQSLDLFHAWFGFQMQWPFQYSHILFIFIGSETLPRILMPPVNVMS